MFDAGPEPLNNDVFKGTAATIHANDNAFLLENQRISQACELVTPNHTQLHPLHPTQPSHPCHPS